VHQAVLSLNREPEKPQAASGILARLPRRRVQVTGVMAAKGVTGRGHYPSQGVDPGPTGLPAAHYADEMSKNMQIRLEYAEY
jgi:hypothetical protein